MAEMLTRVPRVRDCGRSGAGPDLPYGVFGKR